MKISEVAFLVCVLAVLGAMAVPVGDSMATSSRRSVDASNIRQIGQASLIYANDNRERLPPRFGLNEDGEWDGGSKELTPSIHALAAALARFGGLNDSSIWMSRVDQSPAVNLGMGYDQILHKGTKKINPAFAGSGLSFQYIAGLTTMMPSTTPIAVTRGLDVDGRWVKDQRVSVYGAVGGHVVYLGGNVQFTPRKTTWWERLRGQISVTEFQDTQRKPTQNILETITDRQGIYSFPKTPTGTADGLAGIGKPWPGAGK